MISQSLKSKVKQCQVYNKAAFNKYEKYQHMYRNFILKNKADKK